MLRKKKSKKRKKKQQKSTSETYFSSQFLWFEKLNNNLAWTRLVCHLAATDSMHEWNKNKIRDRILRCWQQNTEMKHEVCKQRLEAFDIIFQFVFSFESNRKKWFACQFKAFYSYFIYLLHVPEPLVEQVILILGSLSLSPSVH